MIDFIRGYGRCTALIFAGGGWRRRGAMAICIQGYGMRDGAMENPLAEIGRLRRLAGDLQKANDELRAEQGRFSMLAAQIPAVIYQFKMNPDGSFSFPYMSERVREVFGLSGDEILKDSSIAFALVDPEDLPETLKTIRVSAESMDVWTSEFRIHRPTGELCWIRGFSSPVRLEDGGVLWNGVFLDITESRRAEEAMRLSELRYRSFFENTGTAVVIVEPDNIISLANRKFSQLTGCPIDGVENKRAWTSFVVPQDLSSMEEFYRRWREESTQVPRQYEFRLVTEEGSLRNVHVTVGSIPGTGAIVASLIDITDRIATEERLRESERRFKELADLLPVGIFELDRGLRLVFYNEAALRQFGYSRQEALSGYTALDMVIPADHEKVFSNVALRERGIEPTDHEFTARRRDGSTFPASIYVSIIRRDGGIAGFSGVVIDNTVQKRQESAIREVEERYRALVETSPDSIVLADLEGFIQLANRKAAELHGFGSVREMIGIKVMDLYAPGSRRRILSEIRKLMDGGRLEGLEAEFLRRDGSSFAVELSIAAMRDPEGRPYAFIGISRDIADRKRLEEEIQKRQKLDSLGVLAGGIAHDFNNILTAILGNISLARVSLPAGDAAADRLSIAENACNQAKNLTMQLLTFSKGGAPVKRVVSITGLLRDTVQFSLSGASVRPLFSLAEDLRPVEIDEGQIRQVIHNLIINAEESMPEGGVITITAENADVSPESGLHLAPGHYVKCSVRDQGAGIPARFLKKVFDPYYTTKQKGSGLGLAVSYSIIQRHDGIVTAESREGEGSVFSFHLPAAEGPARERPETGARAERGSAAGRVLVMDDEPLILNVVSHMLAFLGYRCDTVRDGDEAIERYRRSMQEGGRYDAVIMDLTVPGGMGGKDAVTRLRDLDPSVKAIVSSGYSGDPVIAQYREHGFTGAISKPYVIEELSEVLMQALGGA
jgi:two-component system, cell cycle sensor histidine kinase and response regulator CckA